MNLNAAMEDKSAEALNSVGPVLSLAVVKPQFAQYVQRITEIVIEAKAIAITNDETLNIAVMLGGESKKIAKIIEAKRKEVTAEASDFVDSVNGFCKIFVEKLVLNPKKTNADSIEAMLKNKITAYQSRIELERRKQEEAARKAAAELQAKLQAETDEANRKAREEAAKKAEIELRARQAAEAAARKEAESKKEAAARKEREAAEIEAVRKQAEDEAAKHKIQAPTVVAQVFEQTNNVTRTETGASSYQVKNWVCTIIDSAAVPREFCEPVKKLLDDAVKQGLRTIAGCKIEEVTSTRFRT
jgi:chemotaxis protein histidine kinase CheA